MKGIGGRSLAVYQGIANSWLSAGLVILVSFAAAALRLDDYPIYVDGLFSLATAGYFEASSDLAYVITRLAEKSHQHVPGYFLLLHAWARLVDWSPFCLRLISLASGVLSLALIYRIGRSFVSREAGFFALVMLASLYYYNLWYLPIRMYSMFVAAGLLSLWLYLRALRRMPSRTELALLCLANIVFIYTHIFSLALLFGVGLHHLLFVKKDRHWLAVAVAFGGVGLAFLPWLGVLARGLDYAVGRAEAAINTLPAIELLEAIISFGINANMAFLLLLPLGLWQAWRRDRIAILFWTLLLSALAFYVAVNAATGVIDYPRSRYAVIVFPLLILLLVKCLCALSRWKIVMLAVLVFWVAGGMLYQRRVAPGQFVRSYSTIPIHLIERQLRQDFRQGDLLTGWTEGMNLNFKSVVYDGVAEYYFASHKVDVAVEHNWQLDQLEPAEIAGQLEQTLHGRRRVWLAYRPGQRETYERLWQAALSQGFAFCGDYADIQNLSVQLYQSPACD